MVKVVSFKVDDLIYNNLKKLDLNFRELFEPIANEFWLGPESCT